MSSITLHVWCQAECNYKYRGLPNSTISYWFPKLITEEMFCADHNVNRDIGTCYGDSGGPAIRRVFDARDQSSSNFISEPFPCRKDILIEFLSNVG